MSLNHDGAYDLPFYHLYNGQSFVLEIICNFIYIVVIIQMVYKLFLTTLCYYVIVTVIFYIYTLKCLYLNLATK